MKLVLSCAAAAALLGFVHSDARACGGCFAPQAPEQATVVTDHRMALALSETQTVLWDQISYQGNPREFAWVLPVRPGAEIELSRDEWFGALDSFTRTVIYPPNGSGRPVCAIGGCGASEAASSGGSGSPESVDVLAQQVVGPYESVTLRATDPNALVDWLTSHGFAIPPAIDPVIAQYQAAHFDFIALRLRPGCNVRSMKPVRIVTAGADPTLPLRMVAAGVGANVGITLFVIGEGRYRPSNFPDVSIDFGKLTWDYAQGRSNYTLLAQLALEEQGGRGWLTEYSGDLGPLAARYYGQCSAPQNGGGGGSGTSAPPCDRDDAGAEAGAADAEAEASAPDSGRLPDSGPPSLDGGPCAAFDDLSTALRGIHASDARVTRFRANLPATALVEDLRLEATFVQNDVPNVHYANKAINCSAVGAGPSYACASEPRSFDRSDLGSLTIAGAAIVSLALLRRRR
jgi:hypothetical protein